VVGSGEVMRVTCMVGLRRSQDVAMVTAVSTLSPVSTHTWIPACRSVRIRAGPTKAGLSALTDMTGWVPLHVIHEIGRWDRLVVEFGGDGGGGGGVKSYNTAPSHIKTANLAGDIMGKAASGT